MIRVTCARRDGELCLCAAGHAGYAPRGQDIVCAAVSALTLTLAEHLRRSGIPVEEERRPGGLTLRCPGSPAAEAAFAMTLTGIALLAEQYPRYAALEGPSPRLDGERKNTYGNDP